MNVVDHLTAEVRRREAETTKQAERITRLEERLRTNATALIMTALAFHATAELLTSDNPTAAEHYTALAATLRTLVEQSRALLEENNPAGHDGTHDHIPEA